VRRSRGFSRLFTVFATKTARLESDDADQRVPFRGQLEAKWSRTKHVRSISLPKVVESALKIFSIRRSISVAFRRSFLFFPFPTTEAHFARAHGRRSSASKAQATAGDAAIAGGWHQETVTASMGAHSDARAIRAGKHALLLCRPRARVCRVLKKVASMSTR